MRLHPALARHLAASLATACALLGSPVHTPAMPVAEEVLSIVENRYLARYVVDVAGWNERLRAEGAAVTEARALVRSLGDRYSKLLDRKKAADLLRQFDTTGGLNLVQAGPRAAPEGVWALASRTLARRRMRCAAAECIETNQSKTNRFGPWEAGAPPTTTS